MPEFVGKVSVVSPNIYYTHAIKPNGQITWWGDPWYDATEAADPGYVLWEPPPLDWMSSLPNNIVQIIHPATVLSSSGRVSQIRPSLTYRPNFIDRFDIESTPVPSDLTDVVQIASGFGFTAALRRNGKVDVWGFMRVPDNTPNARFVSSPQGTMFYRPAAELMVETFGPNGLTNIVQISGPREYDHLLALRSDGTVTGLGYVWEAGVYTKSPATNSIPANLTNVARVYAGNYFNVALKPDGTLSGWTEPLSTTEGPFPSLQFMEKIAAATNVVKVALGNMHAAWLTTDGKVHAAHALDGYESVEGAPLPASYPQTNTSDWRNVIDVYAGGLRTYGIVLPTNALSIQGSGSGMFALDSTSYTFPTAVVGVSQKTQSFTVRNTGASPTTFDVTLGGANVHDFEVVGLSGNITLQPGASTNIQVRFAPTVAGVNKTVQLRVAGNSAESVVNLSGDAVSAQTDTNGISPALRHIFGDFNADLDQPSNRHQFLSGLGLYTPQSIMDLSFGARMVQKTGSNAIVELNLQMTDDLTKTPFSNYQRITNTIPMPGNKGFLRVRAGNN